MNIQQLQHYLTRKTAFVKNLDLSIFFQHGNAGQSLLTKANELNRPVVSYLVLPAVTRRQLPK